MYNGQKQHKEEAILKIQHNKQLFLKIFSISK